MGYRLHYAQKYEPNWQGGYFNWASDKFAELVYSEFADNYWMNDDESELELERQDINKYIKKLLKKPEAKNKYLPDYTNREVAEVFALMLQSDDDVIHMEWF